MLFWFGVGDGELIRQSKADGIVPVYLLDEPSHEDIPGVRIRTPVDVMNVVSLFFSGHIDAFLLAETDLAYDHPWGANDHERMFRHKVVTELCGHAASCTRYWGNSTIDGLLGVWNLTGNIVPLLTAPGIKDIVPDSCPALVIGAGPSLDKLLPMLPELRKHCLIVCADSVATKLQAAGCDPHFVTALERLNSTAQKVASYTGEATLCAMPVVPRATFTPFRKYVRVCHDDSLYSWACIGDDAIVTGSTSGTMAVAVACHLTRGDVYLLGHDLLIDDGQYASGMTRFAHNEPEVPCIGNDGNSHVTKPSWMGAGSDIAWMGESLNAAGRKLFNLSAGMGMGLRITNAVPATVHDIPDVIRYAGMKLDEPRVVRSNVVSKGRNLSDDFARLVAHAATVKAGDDLDIRSIVGEDNAEIFSYILRPLYCQMSVERRLGRNPEHIAAMYSQRIRNLGRECGGVFKDMSACFGGAA